MKSVLVREEILGTLEDADAMLDKLELSDAEAWASLSLKQVIKDLNVELVKQVGAAICERETK